MRTRMQSVHCLQIQTRWQTTSTPCARLSGKAPRKQIY